MLTKIINNSDMDKVKEHVMPRNNITITDSKLNAAKAYEAAGYSQTEIAERLGVSASTVAKALRNS